MQVYLKLLVLAFRLIICLKIKYGIKLMLNAKVVTHSALVLTREYVTPIRDNII